MPVSLMSGLSNMGYYTTYGLAIIGDPAKIDACETDIKSNTSCDAEDLINTGYSEERWHNWKKEMDGVAKRNPDVIIVLTGDGEETGDSWQARWKGELFEYHVVEMPPFSTPELQIPKK